VKPALLDLNVLVALTWPSHIHHKAAHAWLTANRQHTWATCPITQSGLLRISSNPKIIPEAVSPAQALTLLNTLVELPEHQFWPDAVSVTDSPVFQGKTLLGHRQVTDAYLLSLCIHNEGRLVTFDKAIKTMAAGYSDCVCVLEH